MPYRAERAGVGYQVTLRFTYPRFSACHVPWLGHVAPLFQLRDEQLEVPAK
ncbi:hypothetical protein OIE74_28730 [Streptomyces sp. NBC_01716]|nr:hypothetical protein [Streptomyces sp. NBC_01716]